MEMTARRMAGIALAAFALLVVVRPPRPTGRTYDDALRQGSAEDRVRRALEATNDTLQTVELTKLSRELRVRIEGQLAATPAEARDRIIMDPRIPESLRRHTESVYAESRARMPHSSMALPIFVLLDQSQLYRLGSMIWIERDGDMVPTCASVLRVRASDKGMRDSRQMIRDIRRTLPPDFPQPRHFGLCGFEAAFGPPSPAMRQWLQEREFRPVVTGYDMSVSARSSPGLRDNLIPWYLAADNGAMALTLRACASGRSDQCLAAIAPTYRRGVADLATPSSEWNWYFWRYTGSLDLMNALASSLGPDRFAVLWRADEAPDKAYHRLTGVPIDTLARRVLLGNSPPLRAGATVKLTDVLVDLGIALLLAGLAAFSNPRRFRN